MRLRSVSCSPCYFSFHGKSCTSTREFQYHQLARALCITHTPIKYRTRYCNSVVHLPGIKQRLYNSTMISWHYFKDEQVIWLFLLLRIIIPVGRNNQPLLNSLRKVLKKHFLRLDFMTFNAYMPIKVKNQTSLQHGIFSWVFHNSVFIFWNIS